MVNRFGEIKGMRLLVHRVQKQRRSEVAAESHPYDSQTKKNGKLDVCPTHSARSRRASHMQEVVSGAMRNWSSANETSTRSR